MKILKGRIAEANLPFRIPLKTFKETLRARKIFLIKLEDSSGNFSFGEAAPLPEFGGVGYLQTKKMLINFIESLDKNPVNIDDRESLKIFLEKNQLTGAARSAIEFAVVSLVYSNNFQKILKYYGINEIHNPRVNGLIGLGSSEEVVTGAKELKGKGFSTVKMKCGNNFDEDIKRIEYLSKIFDDEKSIRVDFNQSLEIDEALKYFDALKIFNIDYAEDPLKNFENYEELKDFSKIEIACDEPIRNFLDLESIQNNFAIDALVLKPSLLGSIDYPLRKNISKRVIISSALETHLGLINAFISAQFFRNEKAHGLSTIDIFNVSSLPKFFSIENGSIQIARDLENFMSEVNKYFENLL